jgi:hypothetical protein
VSETERMRSSIACSHVVLSIIQCMRDRWKVDLMHMYIPVVHILTVLYACIMYACLMYSMIHACLYHHALTGVFASREDRVSGVHHTVYGTNHRHRYTSFTHSEYYA